VEEGNIFMATSTERPESNAGSEQGGAGRFRRVLRNRNFLFLWIAQLISMTIWNAANFGLVVLVNKGANGTFLAGLAIISFTLPAIPFSAIAGAIVDRLNKRVVLWVSNLLRMVMMFLMFISLLLDPNGIWPLFVLIFLTSLVSQFFTPAEGSSIPLLVGERDLVPALSLFNITLTISQAVGYLLLGSLVARLFPPFSFMLGKRLFDVQSLDSLFVLIAFFYLVCVVLILCIPTSAFAQKRLHSEHHQDGQGHWAVAVDAWKTLWHDIVGGWQIIRGDRLLYFSVIQFSLIGVLTQLIGELAGTFVQQILHHPAEDMALVLAPAAIGLVGASVFMTNIVRKVGRIRLTVIGFISLAAGFAIIPILRWIALLIDPKNGLTSPTFLVVIVVILILLGTAMACVNIPTQAIMQERSPEDGRARVISLQFMIYSTGTVPVLLFAGAFTTFVGLIPVIYLVAASLLIFCWWGVNYIKKGTNMKTEAEQGA
jgi:MFS family permease